MPPIKVTGYCTCGNVDPVKYRQLRKTDKENGLLIGKFCKKCHKEWLRPEYARLSPGTGDVPDSGTPYDLDTLLENHPIEIEVDSAFQVQSSRTKINNDHFAEQLKVGDHVTWDRPYVIWHHGILTEVDAKKEQIRIIHWNKDEKSGIWEISQKYLPMNENSNSAFNQMYRIDYPEEITIINPTELVLARARSRENDTGYNPATDNCEHYATYCKTGCVNSHQISWLRGKIIECLAIPAVKSFIEVLVSEFVEYLVGNASENGTKIFRPVKFCWSQGVGAVCVIIIETIIVSYDYYKYLKKRRGGDISKREFIKEMTRRIHEGVWTSVGATALGVGCSLVASVCFRVTGPLGLFAVGLIAGVIGGTGGRLFGTWIGSKHGKARALRYVDDRAVTKINLLRRGDHIILACKSVPNTCKECHAIVLETQEESENRERKEQILVIRKTHGGGITTEWIPFKKRDLYRVEYTSETSRDPEDVIRSANLKRKNMAYTVDDCETFARECKRKKLTLSL